MLLLDETNAADYLRDAGRIGRDEAVTVRELSGGVSNVVLHVSRAGGPDLVLKQARGQLRVAEEWLCGVERIWREVETLRICRELIDAAPTGNANTPEVLFEDLENYSFGMTSAPRNHRVWKAELLAGRVDPKVSVACGKLLATLHAGGWRNRSIADRLADRQFFVALRIDPYYRRVAEVHPELREPLERLIDSLDAHRRTLVHGDFSPKNLLLFDCWLWLIDCEVGHYGDPAFDLGFFLSHLVLKWLRSEEADSPLAAAIDEFWATYREMLAPAIGDEEFRALEQRSMNNLAACVLARVDGKSRVDYLSAAGQAAARRLGSSLLLDRADNWRAAASRIRETMG